jgi:hypothetical protein
MTLELFEIIKDELRQRDVNNRVQEILLGMCRSSLVQVEERGKGCSSTQRQSVKVIEKHKLVSCSGGEGKATTDSNTKSSEPEVTAESVEEGSDLESILGGCDAIEVEVGESKASVEEEVSDTNLDMFGAMFK